MLYTMTSHGYHPLQLETFVVRIWREPSGLAWRGEIIHLPDRVSRRFASLAQAQAFIAGYAPEVDGATSSEWEPATPEE